MDSLEGLNVKDLPIMPQVATKILQLQEGNLEISFKELERVILIDPALTAKILKIANSALYSRQKEITNLQRAITLLGFKIIKSLVLLVCASDLFGKSKKSRNLENKFWKHLILTAFLSKSVASRINMDDIAEDAFIAGLLHDIGGVIMLQNNEERYSEFINQLSGRTEKIFDLEEKVFGYNHGQVGRLVLEQWNFPDELVDTVEQHHSQNITSKHKDIIMIVGLGNIYAKIIAEDALSDEDNELHKFYLEALNISDDTDEYFKTEYVNELEKDELYALCSSIVG